MLCMYGEIIMKVDLKVEGMIKDIVINELHRIDKITSTYQINQAFKKQMEVGLKIAYREMDKLRKNLYLLEEEIRILKGKKIKREYVRR